MNIAMIKTLVSGGDSIEARKMRENEVTIVNKAFVVMLANDFPKTIGDAGYIDRQGFMYADRSSTMEDTFDESLYFKADTNIKEWLKEDEVANAFVELICTYYNRYKNNRTPKPAWVMRAIHDNVECTSSWSWVCENYSIYDGDAIKDFDGEKNEKGQYRFNNDLVGANFVRFDMMFKIYKDGGGKDSSTKFGRNLTEHGMYPSNRKIKGKSVTVRVGLSIFKDECDIVEDDDL
jgi:hypothetical protein